MEETNENTAGFPEYRRRDNGLMCTKRRVGLDNRWVVPYSPYLLLKYGCHTNVEVCSTVEFIKYVHKYIFKGPDRASIRVDRDGGHYIDELQDYVDGRYVSPVEACWRLFRFSMHGCSHAIAHLPVHLPDEQQIYFPNSQQGAQDAAATVQETKLTQFFALCSETGPHAEFARTLTYQDLPLHFCWADNRWKPRARNLKVIGRVYTVSIREGERFYLRLLLTQVAGPTSFEHLRTVNGVLHPTFKDACVASSLIEDDTEWDRTMTEATIWQMPQQLCNLFASLLFFGQPADPSALWDKHKDAMTEDIRRTHQHAPTAYRLAAIQINASLQSFGTSWDQISGLPHFDLTANDADDSFALREELNAYHHDDLQQSASRVDMLNYGQREAFTTVLEAVNGNSQTNMFFLDGPGGTGKTFLYETLAATIRLDGRIVLTVASSGIAALLLQGGRTAHSRFKIPLNLTSTSTCNIAANSDLAVLLRATSLIIWDEAPMIHKHAFEALDRTLKDVMQSQETMGGIVCLLGGDFRQILPVVLRGSRSQIVDASLCRSRLWPSIQRLALTENMRVTAEQGDFADWLLEIGQGTHFRFPDVNIPPQMYVEGNSMDHLIDKVFPNIQQNYTDTAYMDGRVILTTTNADADAVNQLITHRIYGANQGHAYLSADSLEDSDEGALFPTEFLNSLTPNGLPPHRLLLHEGMVIMLLRNMDKRLGLCNGSRLLIRRLQQHVIDAEVLTGARRGSRVYIPRITLSPATHLLPFQLQRRQFPVRPAYAMTINKSQGQTLRTVGISLIKPVFTHGQLYVALSRARNMDSIHILSETSTVQNCVYNEVFS
mmetsp:Transcript_13935/g.25805  ORF Transcript_13935/g.25805 Transcript_13935/m.25805 type:complete len:831 (-) Transcript_13935:1923-4415(-)